MVFLLLKRISLSNFVSIRINRTIENAESVDLRFPTMKPPDQKILAAQRFTEISSLNIKSFTNNEKDFDLAKGVPAERLVLFLIIETV